MQAPTAVDTASAIIAAHRAYATWGLIAAVILEGVAIALLLAHKGWDWVVSAPTTNIRLLNGIALFSGFNVSMMVVGYAAHAYPPTDFVWTVEAALLVMCGLDITQFRIKRKWTDANIQSNQNIQSGITPCPVPPPDDALPDAPAPPPSPALRSPLPPMTSKKAAIAAHKYEPGN